MQKYNLIQHKINFSTFQNKYEYELYSCNIHTMTNTLKNIQSYMLYASCSLTAFIAIVY